MAANSGKVRPSFSRPGLNWIASYLFGLLLFGPVAVPLALGIDDPPSLSAGGVTIDLKTQLERGLRARRPVEFAYIAEIVKLVEEKKLPRPLVDSTFGWARNKPTMQLQYFQFALESRAKKLGIQTPNLNNQAVGVFSRTGSAAQ